MKKLMFVAVAALSTAAFADEFKHVDVSANATGVYDVTITTKHLAHSEKTVSKSFKSKRNGATAYEQFQQYCKEEDVENLPGFKVIDLNGQVKIDVAEEELKVEKITFKYSYFEKNGTVSKVISKTSNGVYDANSGKVYLWDKSNKVTVKYDQSNKDIIVASKTDSKGYEKEQKGFKAYEVPLAMHKQFVDTVDNKAAGGFTGGTAVATDGTELDFQGLTAFGTGTLDTKDATVKTVAGNVAGKYPNDLKYGCYGTWKLNKDSKNYGNAAIQAILLKKGCVELISEAM